MVLCFISTIFCHPLIFYGAILPAAVALGIKLTIKKLRGSLDPTNEEDISGKTVIVTGASDGIGKFTAEGFAIRGARVILACRNVAKTEKAVEDIRSRTKNGELIILHLDLSSLTSVRKFALEYISKYGGPSNSGLSILVNNAGIENKSGERRTTPDGFEEHFGVNHLGPFLLTLLLLPELERAGETSPVASRVVNVSSQGHAWGRINFDDLMYEKTPLDDWKWFSQLYSNSKLANNLFNLELAKRLRAKGANVRSYALCPGFVDTNMANADTKDNPVAVVLKNVVFPVLRFFMVKDAREGAETTLYCALSKYLAHHSGEMYKNCQFWDYSQRPKLSEKDAALLWERSEKLVKLA